MSEARILHLDDFRHSPIARRRQDPPFMMLYRPGALREWCKTASIEAKALALELLVEEFCRGQAFPSEQAAAAALRNDGCHHVQPRRLRRIKEQSPDGFALIEQLSQAAREKYQDENRPKKWGKKNAKTPAKPPNRRIEERTSDKEEALQPLPMSEGNAPIAAPCLEASTAPAREQEPSRGELRTFPEAPSPASPPDCPPPPPREPFRRLLGHHDDCVCATCCRLRAREAETESATPSPIQPPELGPPEQISPLEMLAAVAAALKSANQQEAPRAEPTAEQLAAAEEARKYLRRVEFGPDGQGKGYLR